ncbi:MAG TPA: hypothetical protein VK731_13600 [Candidatus Cybelea sp.]|nr:hypothetical protein [Candidatus Cybelea sp.]
MLALACTSGGVARAQLQIVPEPESPSVFSGEGRKVAVVFQNPGAQPAEAHLRTQIYQASSATAVAIGKPADWKTLEVLPGQTVLESAALDFPAVKAETKFIVQWLEGDGHVVGTTEVRVYPADLLAQLGKLAGNNGLGVFDPQNELKPLLKNQKVEFEDLENSSVENFSGRLAIIGPFQSSEQMREGLTAQIKDLAKKNAGVAWLQPPPDKTKRSKDQPSPSFYSVMEGTNAIVVVQSELVGRLPENPQSQLNLVYFCQQALHPQPPALPNPSQRP